MTEKTKQELYIVLDNYTPDAGSTIYGVFPTNELAKQCIAHLEDADNNPYGQNMNEEDTIEIYSTSLETDPTYV